jgi:hypothetical protein
MAAPPRRPARPSRDPRFYPTDEQIEAATTELTQKSLAEIHRETAIAWAARGAAAMRLYEASNEDDAVEWLVDAGEYLHEALEHAALATDIPTSAAEELDTHLERIAHILRMQE